MIKDKVNAWLGDLADEYLATVAKPPETKYTENHHILPRSLFPELADFSENIVTLDILDHLKAHEILAKSNEPKMIMAFWMMFTYSERRYSECSIEQKAELLKKYEVARIKMKKIKSEWGKTRTGELNPFYGKTHTEEFKLENSKRHKGKILPDYHRRALSKAHLGKPKPKIECPHCKQMVYKHIAPRTHFDKCKLKED